MHVCVWTSGFKLSRQLGFLWLLRHVYLRSLPVCSVNSRHAKRPEGTHSPPAALFPIFLLSEGGLCLCFHPDQKPHVYCPGHMVENVTLGKPCIRLPAWGDKVLSVQTQRLSLKRLVFDKKPLCQSMAKPAALGNGHKSLLWFLLFLWSFPSSLQNGTAGLGKSHSKYFRLEEAVGSAKVW